VSGIVVRTLGYLLISLVGLAVPLFDFPVNFLVYMFCWFGGIMLVEFEIKKQRGDWFK